MLRIITASLYKLFRERTFIVTLIIGLILSVLMPLLYKLIGLVSGSMMLMSSISPSSNFGLTVPINAVVMTVGEFTCGAIRNKVIAGHRKSTIYISLLISGIIFTMILMAMYIGSSILFGCLFGGGFQTAQVTIDNQYLGTLVASCITTYIFIASFSIFVATMMRQIGGSLPILVIVLVVLGLLPIFLLGKEIEHGVFKIACWLDPLFFTGYASNIVTRLIDGIYHIEFSGAERAGSIISPLLYSGLFTALGIWMFNKRDIK